MPLFAKTKDVRTVSSAASSSNSGKADCLREVAFLSIYSDAKGGRLKLTSIESDAVRSARGHSYT